MKVPRALLDAVRGAARRGHPFEVCGVLVGVARDEAREVRRAVAVSNKERELPRVRYVIDPADLLRIQRQSERDGLDIVGYYHSHPDHPARPSETDRRIAAEGLSDGVAHVVVSVDAGGRTEVTGWIFRDASQAFEPEAIEEV